MAYLYETHCHCAQCSRCAHSSSGELVRAYHAAGYAGLVLTDHFILGNTAVDTALPWADQMRIYYDAFLQAKAAAEPLDMDVIFGIEHACDGREFLCYGIGLDFLLSNPDIPNLAIADFTQRVHRWGGLVIQAHPYRYAPGDTPLQLDVLDGIEVYNSANSSYANEAARNAVQNGMILTCGGDTHRADDPRIGQAGILLPYRVHDSQQLAYALRQNHHRLHISQPYNE